MGVVRLPKILVLTIDGFVSAQRRRDGCDGSASPVGCDMAVLQQFSSQQQHVALVHIPDAGSGKAPAAMSGAGVVKLAAFLWAAGPSSTDPFSRLVLRGAHS